MGGLTKFSPDEGTPSPPRKKNLPPPAIDPVLFVKTSAGVYYFLSGRYCANTSTVISHRPLSCRALVVLYFCLLVFVCVCYFIFVLTYLLFVMRVQHYKTFKVRGTSIVITITSYWYYNQILLLKPPDYFATDVLLMIGWSMAIYDRSISSMDTAVISLSH